MGISQADGRAKEESRPSGERGRGDKSENDSTVMVATAMAMAAGEVEDGKSGWWED